MLQNCYLVENHKTDNNSTNIEAKEKTRTNLKSLDIKKLFDGCWINFNFLNEPQMFSDSQAREH
jgi:hypothetical protein